jgi:serine/tyrosine/threonine adenylyltransferase
LVISNLPPRPASRNCCALADYVLARHYPCLTGQPNQYADLFLLIAQNTAEMIARWQAIGFNHGVMNTDNMSILGDTFDFGPYGFLDTFNPHHICNHSDDQGRYAFDRQPAIAHWNLAVLAQALSSLVPEDALKEGMQHYARHFNDRYIALMRAKLGLEQEREDDTDLLMQCLGMLNSGKLDYNRFFRELGAWQATPQQPHALREHTLDLAAFDAWLARYAARLAEEKPDSSTRRANMDAVNPLYVLRNHLAQLAIQQAEQGDYSEVRRLHAVLQSPFTEQAGAEIYAQLPPDWAAGLEVSCSS